MKKFSFKRLITFALALAMSFTLFACTDSAKAETAYMTMDINPTIEFVLEDGKVVSVNTVNDDAAVLVSSEDFVGKTVEEVAEQIVALAEELGYLTNQNNDVKITISADSEELIVKLKDKAKIGAERGSNKAKVNTNPRYEDTRTAKKLKEENPELFKNINPEKVRLIESIMKYDETFTYEMGANMKIKELVDILEDYLEEYKDLVGDSLKKEFKKEFEEFKDLVERQIAEVYGAEFLAMWDKVNALETAFDALEKKAEELTLTSQDIEQIVTILGLENAELISKDGVVTLESVERYLDKHFDDDFMTDIDEDALEDLEDAIEDILDKYDEDEYTLTQEDITALETAWGETLELTAGITLDEVEEIIENKEEVLEDLQETISDSLSEIQKTAIKAIKEQLSNFKKIAYEEMSGRIEQVKNEFHTAKQEKKNK